MKLRAERELGEWAGQFIDPNAAPEDDGSDGNNGKPMQFIEDKIWSDGLQALERSDQFDPDLPTFKDNTGLGSSLQREDDNDDDDDDPLVSPYLISGKPCVTSVPSQVLVPGMGLTPVRRDPVIVIIRHGKQVITCSDCLPVGMMFRKFVCFDPDAALCVCLRALPTETRLTFSVPDWPRMELKRQRKPEDC